MSVFLKHEINNTRELLRDNFDIQIHQREYVVDDLYIGHQNIVSFPQEIKN